MDCNGIQKRLSEYIDGALDEQTARTVEKHISTCKDCKEEYDSLSAVVKALNTLEPMTAPADFLEKIHERMKPRSQVNRLFRKLFVPFKIKIPLQLAAAAVVSILVVLVFNFQKSKLQMVQPYHTYTSPKAAGKVKTDHIGSLYKEATKPPAPAFEENPPMMSENEEDSRAQRFGNQLSGQSRIQTESRSASPMPANAGPSAESGRPIELNLVLKAGGIETEIPSHPAMKAAQMRKNTEAATKEESIDKDRSKRSIEARQENRTQTFLSGMNHILSPLRGKVLSVNYPENANGSGSVLVQIPAKNYASFCEDIGRLTEFNTPPPALSDKGPKTVTLIIKFSSPE